MKKLLILLLALFFLGAQLPTHAQGVSFGIPLPFPFLFYNFGPTYYGPGYYGGYYPRASTYYNGYYPRAYWGRPGYYYRRSYYGGYYRPYYRPRYWGYGPGWYGYGGWYGY
jgi:hypothetical protein